MTFRVADIARTRAFYAACLAPLGYTLKHEERLADGSRMIGFDNGKFPDTWFVDGPSPWGGHPASTGCHLAWRAPSRAAVDEFHRAALAAGGRDNGAPGLRPQYHPNYYGAFVIDPDGNNVEAVCHLGA